jgi:hypothetical protein
MELRFKKFIFHHFEHSTNSLKKTEGEIKKELAEEKLKAIKQSKEIKKIEKKIDDVKNKSKIFNFLKRKSKNNKKKD